ncbi:unnamed protein product [Diamesa serratosioi]
MFQVLRNFTIVNKIVLNSFSRTIVDNVKTAINFTKLNYKTKVPQQAVKAQFNESRNEKVKITEDEIILLERLSLVDLDRMEAVKVLEDSIEFANRIQNIDTKNVEPLYTVLEKHQLELREDVVTDGNIQQDVLKNAQITEDEYFLAPSGNIPLK